MNKVNNHQIVCPICKNSEQVFLLEDVYFGLIEHNPPSNARFNLKPNQVKNLLQQIAPPSLDRAPIWVIIPPDSIFATIILAIVLAIIFSDRPLTLEMLIFPLLLGVSYFLFRKKINAQYRQKKNDRLEAINKVQQAADDWSSYFICLADMTVFSGHSHNHFPVDELKTRLQ
jgi:hypothetical protein